MRTTKICPICKTAFIPSGNNQKFCCTACREQNRNAEIQQTIQTAAERRKAERAEAVRAVEDRIVQAKAEHYANIERRASSGEIFAQMQLALIRHDGAAYWELRRLYEAAERERIHAMFI